MNLNTAERVVGCIQIVFFGACAYFCFLIFQFLHPYLIGYTPKNFPQVNSAALEQILREDPRPILVYFYHHKNSEVSRRLLPVLDDFASLYQTQIPFYTYQFGDSDSQRFAPYKGPYDGNTVIFQNEQELTRTNPILFDDKSSNKGSVFLFLEKYVKTLPRSRRFFKPDEDWYLTNDNFETRISNSQKPLLVDFTHPACFSCVNFAPQFKAIGEIYGDLADFYYAKVQDSSALWKKYGVRPYPTILLLDQSKLKQKKTGAYSSQEANEAMIVGMLLPYLMKQ